MQLSATHYRKSELSAPINIGTAAAFTLVAITTLCASIGYQPEWRLMAILMAVFGLAMGAAVFGIRADDVKGYLGLVVATVALLCIAAVVATAMAFAAACFAVRAIAARLMGASQRPPR